LMTGHLDDILRQSVLLHQVRDHIRLRFVISLRGASTKFRLTACGAKRPFIRKRDRVVSM
jgi:hypothetical protein